MSEWTAPSRKWISAFVVAVGALAAAYVQAGEWTTTLSIMAIGIVVERATAYLVPNQGSTEAVKT